MAANETGPASRPSRPPRMEPFSPPELVDLTPEGRRKKALGMADGLAERFDDAVGPGSRARKVLARVWTGVYTDGFIHAGNLAYMTILSMFPFFIAATAIFSVMGERDERASVVATVLRALPPDVADVLRPVALTVIDARSGWLLWIGALFGLWTVGSLVETIRDILRRAYGTRPTRGFLRYRLLTTGIVLGAVVLLMLSLLAQVLIGAAEQVIETWLPALGSLLNKLTLSRLIPTAGLYFSLYLLFYLLTPSAYRKLGCPKWPGAAVVTVWWVVVTMALPVMLKWVFTYDLTYGSLAGSMIVLFFFWLVGLGMVFGAELNAALVETPEERDILGQADNRQRHAWAAAETRQDVRADESIDGR